MALLAALASVAEPTTRRDLTDRMLIDGYPTEWEKDEQMFQRNSSTVPALREESRYDSRWGFNADVNQVYVSWDIRYIYFGVAGIIWDNNIVLYVDYRPGGETDAYEWNAWRRNIHFQGIQPDMILATWDTDTRVWIWRQVRANQLAEVDFINYQQAATFSKGEQGRGMEAAIPWEVFFDEDLIRVFHEAYQESMYVLPDGAGTLGLVCAVVGGGDGTSGPDCAPDNTQRMPLDDSVPAYLDNWMEIPLDLDGDGMVDLDADIRGRSSFQHPLPIENPPYDEVSWGSIKSLFR